MKKTKLLLVSYAALFAAISIYFGTAWSTVIFQFPVLPELLVRNYYQHFVPQGSTATTFLSILVPLMSAVCLVMLKEEWDTRFRWVPIVVFGAIIAAACVHYFFVLPINREMAARINDQTELTSVIGKWVQYTWYRVVLWSVEWLAMMYYFGARAYQSMFK
jgi:hypothetical protein